MLRTTVRGSRSAPKRSSKAAAWAVAVALLAGGDAVAQAPAADETDPWEVLRLLEGSWTGAIDGELGTGTAVRRYELILGGKYLVSRHESVRLPQEKSPDGDQHGELGIFSYDSERRKLVYREFMGEGVVVRSTCDVEGMKRVCLSEAVESGPGIRARLTVDVEDRYRFTEIYELAWPGRELELYFTNRWTRTPRLDVWDWRRRPFRSSG